MDVDINDFHCSPHIDMGLLRETAKQHNVNLTGVLWECQGCSMTKGRGKPILKAAETRAVKSGGRVL